MVKVEGSELSKTIPAVVEWRFDRAQPGWKPALSLPASKTVELEAIPARIEAVQAQATGLPVSPRASGQSLENSEFAARIQVLDASIEAIVAAQELPGLSIGLVHDQDLIWLASYDGLNAELCPH